MSPPCRLSWFFFLTSLNFNCASVGKTTFTKLLTGELQPNDGEVVVGETVVLGVYDQLGLKFDETAEKQTVLEFVVDQIQNNDAKSMGETPNEARDLLRQFEFPQSRWQERISILSGGERRRLQILSVLSVVSIQIISRKNDLGRIHFNLITQPYCLNYTHIRCMQFFFILFHYNQKPNFLILDERK